MLYSDPFDLAFDFLCLTAGHDEEEELIRKAKEKGLFQVVREVL